MTRAQLEQALTDAIQHAPTIWQELPDHPSAAARHGYQVGLRHALNMLPALLAVEPTPTQWQPIETAPKDGTYVLITNGQHCHTAYRRDSLGDDFASWCFYQKYGGAAVVLLGPTHWMPLPALPPTPAPAPPEGRTP